MNMESTIIRAHYYKYPRLISVMSIKERFK